MISVQKAQSLVLKSTRLLSTVKLSLLQSAGHVLSKNVISPVSLPGFHNSAMDGFAVRAKDLSSASQKDPRTLPITGIIQAGDNKSHVVLPGTAMQILTGAPLPRGADAVVMQECVEVRNNHAIFKEIAKPHENVRRKGEEIKKGEVALRKGTFLSAPAVGFLSGCGIDEVLVFKKPNVSILVTGNEVIFHGKPSSGKIRDSNGASLYTALPEIGIRPQAVLHAKDSPEDVLKKIKMLLGKNDVLLICGGVSVGKFDFVKDALKRIGVKQIFWKVRQKPGKPLFFGKKNKTLVFGLPGNPFSVLCCFYEYVCPALLKSMGVKNVYLEERTCVLRNPIRKKKGMTTFLKGRFYTKNGRDYVATGGGQGSHILKTLCNANALVVLPEKKEHFAPGETVRVHLLPSS